MSAYSDLVGLTPPASAATSAEAPPAAYRPSIPYQSDHQPPAEQAGNPGRSDATAIGTARAARPGTESPAAPSDDQARFEAFGPAGGQEPAPVPQVRSGRLLIAVIAAAVLLLVVPLGIVWLVTRPSSPFEVGECVRQSGTAAVAATCQESGAYQIVAKVDAADQCADRTQPFAELPVQGGKSQILCLKPTAG